MRRPVARAFFAVAIAFILSACTFNFLEDADLGADDVLRSERTEIDGGYKLEWFDASDTLQYYDEYYVTGGKVMRIQSYTAAGVLKHAYAYTYDGDNKTLIAYYNASSALVWYQVYKYNANNSVIWTVEYDATNARQWSRQYEYETIATKNVVNKSASYTGSGTMDGYAAYTYDAEANPTSMIAYGSVSCAVAKASMATSASSSASRAPIAFAIPTPPDYTPITMPDAAALATLGVSSRTYWQYDTHGSSEITLNKDWYPTRIARTDDRVAKPVSVDLSWDSYNRISHKKSWYGTTLALDVTMSYTAEGYPLKATTTGAAMLLPLEYELAYAGARPTKLSVSSGGSLLQYFMYEYSGAALPASLDAARTVDPFALLDELQKSSLTIKHYDGDNTLVESFKFLSDSAGLRLNVLTPANVINGYYIAAYDTEGNSASLASYSADGTEQWSQACSYSDAWAALDTAATAEGIDLGRVAETYLTDDMAEYAKGFIMDMLF